MVYAALPPSVQDKIDEKTLRDFVNTHPFVKHSLKYIDVQNHVIVYANSCKAYFKRAEIDHPKGWVGPAAHLYFKESTCDIGDAE